jgi:hypothetical protein
VYIVILHLSGGFQSDIHSLGNKKVEHKPKRIAERKCLPDKALLEKVEPKMCYCLCNYETQPGPSQIHPECQADCSRFHLAHLGFASLEPVLPEPSREEWSSPASYLSRNTPLHMQKSEMPKLFLT